jgi:hypothetical protein
MTPYQVSTPRFTMRIVVDNAGLIRTTAPPYVRRTWRGKAWAPIKARLERQYRSALRITPLTEKETDA